MQACRCGGYRYQADTNGAVPVMTWQPIETAPKDGTVLLVHGERGVELGWCVLSRWYWHGRNSVTEQPTHWMPLPEPPDGVAK
jgi:hypothetical protein